MSRRCRLLRSRVPFAGGVADRLYLGDRCWGVVGTAGRDVVGECRENGERDGEINGSDGRTGGCR